MAGSLGAIPFVGPLANEVIQKVFPSEMEKRRQRWEVLVTEALNSLSFKELENNEEFISLLVTTTEQARRTHLAKKLELLRNSLANSQLPLSFDKKSMFLNWLDQFSEGHLAILQVICNSEDGLVSRHSLEHDMFNNEHIFFDMIKEDMTHNKFLLTGRNEKICVTEMGADFCEFLGLIAAKDKNKLLPKIKAARPT